MKLLVIKAGKAFKTLQRDGIFKGGKRIFSALFAMFGRVRPADVLIVTGGVGDSARYRAHHVAEELQINGITASVTIQDNPLLATYAEKFKVFIFHRTLFTPSVSKLIDNIKKQEKEIIFETDDLVYDPQYLKHMDYFKVMNSLERKLYENGVGGEILNDPYVKVCTTTTTFLAEKLRALGKKVFIVPNKLCKRDVEIVENLQLTTYNLQQKTENVSDTIKIGYFSGTLSHNKDFATVTDALMIIMEKYANVELYLVGPLDIESRLNVYKDRIKQLPYVPREKHFANIASADINIAPLEIGNPFCESKSELKFFEAGIVNVSSICAATQPFVESIEDGVDGFVANGTEEWVEKLEKLINDKNLRISMGQKAREKALVLYTTQNAKNEEYYNYLKLKIKG